MSSILMNQLTGRISLGLGEIENQEKKNRNFTKNRKHSWELQELQLNLNKSDKGFEVELHCNESIFLKYIELSFKLKGGLESMIPSFDWVPWLFIGDRKRNTYMQILGSGKSSALRMKCDKNKITVRWDCRRQLLVGEAFQPEIVKVISGDPRESLSSLELPRSRNEAPLLSCRWFTPQKEGESMLKQLQKDLDRIKQLQIPIESLIFEEHHLPYPGDKPGSPRHKRMDTMLVELKQRDIRPAISYYPLRIPKGHKICHKYPSWFLQDKRGKVVSKKFNGQIWQILDSTHGDVQKYLSKRIALYRSWGIHHLIFRGLEDLLASGPRRTAGDNLQQEIGDFLNRTRETAGEAATLTGDYFFPSIKENPFHYYIPPADKQAGLEELYPQLNLFPLVSEGCKLSAGPLFLTSEASSLSEKVRERIYGFQLLAGGLMILGGPTSALNEELSEKWINLLDSHSEDKKQGIDLEPLGFRQKFLLMKHKMGIAGVFNLHWRKKNLHLTKEDTISDQQLRLENQTRFNSPDLTIAIPGNRSRTMRF